MPAKIHARGVRVYAAILALVVVGWQPVAAQQPIEVKAGISDPVNTVLAWYMARDAGFYAAQGLKVDIINMSGGSRGAAELQAGRLDIMHVGLSSVIRINWAGGDLRTIGSLSNVIRFTFFSAPGAKTAAELKSWRSSPAGVRGWRITWTRASSQRLKPREVLAKELKITDAKVLDITYNDFKAQSPANIEISQPGAENSHAAEVLPLAAGTSMN